MEFEPFLLTLRLRTPMVRPTVDKPLDALLSWAAVERAHYEGSDDPWAAQHELPLERHVTASGQWCFMASNLDFEWVGEAGALHYIRRQKVADYAEAWLRGAFRKLPYVDTSRGATKAGSLLEPLGAVAAIRAWGVGDIEALRALLPYLTHVGKLHHHDHGAVAGFTVEADERAREGWKRRALPADSPHAGSDDFAAAVGALAAPYWKRETHREVRVPL